MVQDFMLLLFVTKETQYLKKQIYQKGKLT